MPRLTRSNYAIPADHLAPALLGCVLVRQLENGQRLKGVIVETEAYLAPEDQASHARNGHRSARVEPMYAKPGISFVYLTRGVHWLFNVSCDRKDSAHAVLVRALEPIEGIEQMHAHRVSGAERVRCSMPSTAGKPLPKFKDRDLCSGPAKLTQSFLIGPEHNSLDLTQPGKQPITADDPGLGQVWIEGKLGSVRSSERICDARIGVESVGKPWDGADLRWSVRGNPNVSVRPKV